MLNKESYINLLNNKKYDQIITNFKNDYIILFSLLLDKKQISYEKNLSFYYYLSFIKKIYPELSSKLNLLLYTINNTDVKSEEKIIDIINIYISIYKTYIKNKKDA